MTLISTLRVFGVSAAAILLQFGTAAEALPQAIIEGTWATQLESEITINACEQGFCGRLSKIVVPQKYIDQYGDELKELSPDQYFDANNKDPALRERPIQDLQILTLRPSDNPFRFDGEIYNPEDGETYQGYVEVLGADTIRLSGCVLYGIVCQGQDWQRVIVPEGSDAAEQGPVAPIPAVRTAQ